MAASAREKDYVHVLASALAKLWGTPPQVRIAGMAEFERHYDSYDLHSKLKGQLDFKADIVLVAIGENVATPVSEAAKTKFNDCFVGLLTALKNNGQPAIVVRSCFWANKTKDEIMQKSCMAVGGVFVDISGLGKDESNYARSERKFVNAAVAAHPGDKGMKAIADALLHAITNRSHKAW